MRPLRAFPAICCPCSVVLGAGGEITPTCGWGDKMMKILLERSDKSLIFVLRNVRNEKFAMIQNPVYTAI